MPETIVEAIFKHAEGMPGHNAVADGEVCLTYGQLASYIQGAAEYLQSTGVRSGDNIIIEGDASVNYIIGYFAIHLVGAVAIPIDRNSPSVSAHRIMEEVNVSRLYVREPDKIPEESTSLDVFSKYFAPPRQGKIFGGGRIQ